MPPKKDHHHKSEKTQQKLVEQLKLDISIAGSGSPSKPPTPDNEIPTEAPSTKQSFLKDKQAILRKTDKDLMECLIKEFPQLTNEIKFLYGCPEGIGMDPLRDILVRQNKGDQYSISNIKSLVVGLKAGLAYSLRDQHNSYIDMFKELKAVIEEASRVMEETSTSLSDTLKSEHKESGRTLSQLKEVLSQTQELAKVLVEGKTHGHLQKPSAPPQKPTAPEPEPIPPSKTDDPEEEKSLKELLSEVMRNINLDNFEARTTCTSGFIQIKTMSEGTRYLLTYNEKARRWFFRTEDKNELATEEEKPYIDLFLRIMTSKRLAEKPLLFVIGWQIYKCLKSLAPEEDTDELWEEHHKYAYRLVGL